MKIAWVTHAPTATGHGGGATYNRAIFRLLAALPGRHEVIEIPLRAGPSRLPHGLRRLVAIARSLLSPYPAKAMFHIPLGALPALQQRISAADPDLVVFNSADILPCQAVIGDRPFAVIAHNVEQLLYADQVEAAIRRFPVARGLLQTDLAKLTRMETEGLRAASLIIAISHEDADWFEHKNIDTPIFVLPPTFPAPLPDHPRPAPVRPLRLAFVAKFSWWPNRRGCDWLIREVMAKLPAGAAELHIYGPGSESYENPAAGIRGHGFVERLEDVWTDNHIAVCPIGDGSGVNVKFVESLVNGMPIISTRFGTRGLPEIGEDPAIRLCDTAQDWIDILSSGEAEELARLTPGDKVRSLFLDETYLEPLAAALERNRP